MRERLLSRQKGLEQREKARKLRDLKKFGKKVGDLHIQVEHQCDVVCVCVYPSFSWYIISPDSDLHLQVQQEIIQKRREEKKNAIRSLKKG